jgi:copper chaperone
MSKQVKLNAPDISCNHCAMAIKRELATVKGLTRVEVDVPTKTVNLEYDTDETLERAKAALADIGYPVAQPKA